MKLLKTFVILLITTLSLNAKKNIHDAHIVGDVLCDGEHLAYANVFLKGTTIGTVTDETGHFQLINVDPGTYTIVSQTMGYKASEQKITVKADEITEVRFQLEKDALMVDEVVVTGNKHAVKRAKSVTIVNSLPAKLLQNTSAISISEGLNFCSGLRMENNCQNCGFNQVRMNGMEGPYSQILINGNPIFSGLAGVYGLELIPSNMIEKIEVVKGGGSSIYGGNAIAGTINMRLKNPTRNSFSIGQSTSAIGLGVDNRGDVAFEKTVNADVSVVTSDRTAGISIYGFYRDRDPFDANGDGYSEVPTLENTTFGTRAFHNLGTRAKLALDFFVINEDRRGGNKFNNIAHEADIAEQLNHKITTTALTYTQFFREQDLLTVYGSTQFVDRDSYYGSYKSLADYGKTEGKSFALGANYSGNFDDLTFVAGLELKGEQLKDHKLGHLLSDSLKANAKKQNLHSDNVKLADQESYTPGLFGQVEYQLLRNLKLSVGARIDNYYIKNNVENSEIDGFVFSPRLNFLYDINKMFQFRGSYSSGYRAPQLFDEDLHIESSGKRRIIHKNDPNLKQENSHSFMGSINTRKQFENASFELLTEGFYTLLENPFATSREENKVTKVITERRFNEDAGAFVAGLNLEFRVTSENIKINMGYTIQKSQFEEAVDIFEDGKIMEKEFLRTPSNYGFISFDYDIIKELCLNINGTYTGSMKVMHDYESENAKIQELVETDSFFDLGAKLTYTYKINGTKIDLFTGAKNVFNSYQNDFDKGNDRDAGYIYGPMQPRTLYIGANFKL